MLTFRPIYLLFTLVLFVVEILIALYVRDDFLRPYGGDFLVVILIYCFLRAFIDQPAPKLAVATLVFAFTVEFAQYFRIVEVLGLAGNKIAETVIGTGFSIPDLVAYTLGVTVVYGLERRLN